MLSAQTIPSPVKVSIKKFLKMFWSIFSYYCLRPIQDDDVQINCFSNRNINLSVYEIIFHGWELKHLQLLRNCFCPQACGSTSWCSPFKIYTAVSMEVAQYAWGQRQKVIEGEGVKDEKSWALEVSTWWGGWGPARKPPQQAQSLPCVR